MGYELPALRASSADRDHDRDLTGFDPTANVDAFWP
jgi:hypothetical protein